MSQRRLPAEIYWRRRLLLLALVILLVWGVLQVTDRGGDDAPAAAATSTTATPAVTPTPAVATTPEAMVDGLVDVALTTAAKACDPERIRITPTVRGGQLTKGPIDIGLVVSSTATEACTLEPDDAEAIAVISANGTPIWDSTVCKSSLLTQPIAVSPEWATLATVQWTGRGSGSQCTSNEGWATPGKYTIQIGTLGGEPGKTSFTVARRPAAPRTTAPATPAPTKPAATTPTKPAATTPTKPAATKPTPTAPAAD
ncbi:MAG: hypothetical protein ABW004_04125 [Aeromicrobium sp.]